MCVLMGPMAVGPVEDLLYTVGRGEGGREGERERESISGDLQELTKLSILS